MLVFKKVCTYTEDIREDNNHILRLNISFPDSGLIQIVSSEDINTNAFIEMCLGKKNPECGTIKYEKKDIYNKKYNNSYCRNVGLIDDSKLDCDDTVIDYLKVLHGIKTDDKINEELTKLGLCCGFKEKKISELSEKELISFKIDLALLREPKILVVDLKDICTFDNCFHQLKDYSKEHLVILIDRSGEKEYDGVDQKIIIDTALEEFKCSKEHKKESKCRKKNFKFSFLCSLALEQIKKSKVRFILMSILSVFTFAFLFNTLNVHYADIERDEIQQCYRNHQENILIQKKTCGWTFKSFKYGCNVAAFVKNDVKKILKYDINASYNDFTKPLSEAVVDDKLTESINIVKIALSGNVSKDMSFIRSFGSKMHIGGYLRLITPFSAEYNKLREIQENYKTKPLIYFSITLLIIASFVLSRLSMIKMTKENAVSLKMLYRQGANDIDLFLINFVQQGIVGITSFLFALLSSALFAPLLNLAFDSYLIYPNPLSILVSVICIFLFAFLTSYSMRKIRRDIKAGKDIK